jgi:MoaA/NifB/PqqE/SkfB family radical SAM enzyme
LAGDYSLCQNCPELGAGYAVRHPAAGLQPFMSDGPKRVVIENDLTCNLSCWSCRSDLIVEGSQRQHRIAKALAGLDAWADSLEFMSILQSGEVFSSRPCLDWLSTFEPARWPKLKIELFTNGTLLAKRWPEIAAAHERITRMLISVDAATPATYERVRRGGRWEDVRSGLALARELRRAGQLPDGLQLNFVVQPDNFREMLAFVDMCAEFDATEAHLAIMNPSWHDDRTFAPHDLRRSDHPLRDEFVDAAEHLAERARRCERTNTGLAIVAHTVWRAAFGQWTV